MTKVRIKPEKGAVALIALFDYAAGPRDQTLSEAEARDAMAVNDYIWDLKGRSLHIRIDNDILDLDKYDAYNGEGTALRALTDRGIFTSNPKDIWYSCEIRRYCGFDEWENSDRFYLTVVWTEYEVIKTTPKGVWLQDPDGSRISVRGTGVHQSAFPTKSLALEDAYRKKITHVKALRTRLEKATEESRMILKALVDHESDDGF